MRFLLPQQPDSSDSLLDSSSTTTTSTKEQILKTWKELCFDRSQNLIEIFHPQQYDKEKTKNCSSSLFDFLPALTTTTTPTSWSSCWSKQCLELVNSIWGCAWKKKKKKDGESSDDDEEDSPCPNQFHTILHQVRHPLDSIDILNSTVCSNKYPKLKQAFFNLIEGWFPTTENDNIDNSIGRQSSSSSSSSSSWDSMSCIDAMGWYIINFHTTLLNARSLGKIDGMFQIENTSPCDVINQAGFLDEHTSLYWNQQRTKISEQCRGGGVDSNAAAAAAAGISSPDTFTRVKTESGIQIPDNDKKLKLEEFHSNLQLQKELKELISKLGYDNNNNNNNDNIGSDDEQSEFL